MIGLLQVDVCMECDGIAVPGEEQLTAWANAAYRDNAPATVCIKIVGHAESASLNEAYRQKQGSTNVLSFPMDELLAPVERILGDIALCAPVIAHEAEDQRKPLDMHWAHMVVHGMLHLQGYDHIADDEAAQMEQLEVDILAGLGYKNPYEETAEAVPAHAANGQ